MATAGKGVLEDSGKRAIRSASGKAAVFDASGACAECCVPCVGAFIVSFTGFGPPSAHNLVPYQGPGIGAIGFSALRWGIFVLPPYGGFHNLTLSTAPSPGANGYMRTDCEDCFPPTHWADAVYGFVDPVTGVLIGLPNVLTISPNVVTIALMTGCVNSDATAVIFPILGARPIF